MKYLLAWSRIILCVLLVFFILAMYLVTIPFLGRNIRRAFKFRKVCVRGMCIVLGYKISTHGFIKQHDPAIYISNHRCFSDPILALKYYYFYPIGKAEVEKYPLIGLGAKETGVIFVNRESKESRSLVKEAIRDTLKEGLSIFLCPEGTTSITQTTKEFKRGAFEAAVELKIPIIPLAMVYSQPEHDFWIPGDTLIQHFIRQFGKWRTSVDIYFPEHAFYGSDTMTLLTECQQWIDEKLILVKVPKHVTDLARHTLKV